MKPIIAAAAFAAACLGAPVALHAQEHHHPVPEQLIYAPSPGDVTLREWSGRVTREIEGQLQYPENLGYPIAETGIVEVKFQCSDSGASDQVSVSKTSGSPMLDRAAVRAVKRLKKLHPVATGIPPNQGYIAMVLFANSAQERAMKLAQINAEVKKRNAWFGGGTRTASSGIVLVPVGS